MIPLWDKTRFQQLCEAGAKAGISQVESGRRSAAIAIIDFLASAVLSGQPGWQQQGHPNPFLGVRVMGHPAILIKDLNDIDEIPIVGKYNSLEIYLLNSPSPLPKLAYIKTLAGTKTSAMLDAPVLQQIRSSVLEGLPEGILTSAAVPGPAKHEFRTIRSGAYLVTQGRKTW